MKRARKRNVFIAIGALLVIIGAIAIWYNISYSPVKRQFQKDISALLADDQLSVDHDLFTADDFAHFPLVIQKYIENCGYIGTPKMSYLKMRYHDVDFLLGKSGTGLKMNYTQYNFVGKPSRMAYMESSMFGIPFEGYDYYQNGPGGMKGVIAKVVTLFDQTGEDMDRACLATFLAESMFAPAILLQDYITFEEINDFEVRATVEYKGQRASGIFSFNEQYEMISFTTKDRAATGMDGSTEYVPWSAICSEYQLSENGIKCPTKFQAVWNYADEDFVYFDGVIGEVTYGYAK